MCRGLDAFAPARFPALKVLAASTSSDDSDEQSIRSNATLSLMAFFSRGLWLASFFQVDGEPYTGFSHYHQHHHRYDVLASEEDLPGCSAWMSTSPPHEKRRIQGHWLLSNWRHLLDEIDAYPAHCGDIRLGDARLMLLALASNLPESTRDEIQKQRENAALE
jgi:hypothetical protein